LLDLFYDPQTSGGLLISLPASESERLEARLRKEGDIHSSIIGEVIAEDPGRIRII